MESRTTSELSVALTQLSNAFDYFNENQRPGQLKCGVYSKVVILLTVSKDHGSELGDRTLVFLSEAY